MLRPADDLAAVAPLLLLPDMQAFDTGATADMITAIQTARLDAATKLIDARRAFGSIRSSIVWTTDDVRAIDKLLLVIGDLFAKVISNEPGPEIKPERDWRREY